MCKFKKNIIGGYSEYFTCKKYIKISHELEPQVCGVLMNSISSVTKCTICQLVPESKHSIRC